MRKGIGIVLLSVGLLLPATLLAGTNLGHRLTKKTASGQYAAVVAGANANHPRQLFMKVTAKPNQRVTVDYSVTCGRGFGAGSRSGHSHGITPVVRTIKHPYTN